MLGGWGSCIPFGVLWERPENKNHNTTIINNCEADRNKEYIVELRFFPMATYFLSKSASRGAGQSYNKNKCEYRVLEKFKIKEHNSWKHKVMVGLVQVLVGYAFSVN